MLYVFVAAPLFTCYWLIGHETVNPQPAGTPVIGTKLAFKNVLRFNRALITDYRLKYPQAEPLVAITNSSLYLMISRVRL